jgi:predicted nucleotidyltransferase
MGDTLQKSRAKKPPLPDRMRAIVALLQAHEDALRARGATSLTLFGSRVRGDEREDSDLDVLIDYDQTCRFTLYDLVEIQRHLSELTGLDAHVTTGAGLAPERLRRLLTHSVDVF